MTFKVLTDDNQNILFCSKLLSTEEPMESNLCLDPLCGEPYPFVKSRPDSYKQNVSHIDDSSREEEEYNNLTTDKILPKDETYGKNGETNEPKNIRFSTYDIIGLTFLMPP